MHHLRRPNDSDTLGVLFVMQDLSHFAVEAWEWSKLFAAIAFLFTRTTVRPDLFFQALRLDFGVLVFEVLFFFFPWYSGLGFGFKKDDLCNGQQWMRGPLPDLFRNPRMSHFLHSV